MSAIDSISDWALYREDVAACALGSDEPDAPQELVPLCHPTEPLLCEFLPRGRAELRCAHCGGGRLTLCVVRWETYLEHHCHPGAGVHVTVFPPAGSVHLDCAARVGKKRMRYCGRHVGVLMLAEVVAN